MTRGLWLAAALALLSTRPVEAQNSAKLSGTWTLNSTRSDYGDMPGPKAQTDVIDTAGPNIRLSVTSTMRRSTRSYVLTFPTDGTETVEPGTPEIRIGPAALRRLSAVWRAGTLELTEQVQIEDETFVLDNMYSVSADGQILTVVSSIRNGPRLQVMLFNRR